MSRSSRLFRLVACASALLAAVTTRAATNEVSHWNRIAVDATTRAMPLDPNTESRILSIVHVAMHDAVNAIQPRFRTFASRPENAAGASLEAAVASAACTALGALLPNERAAFETECNARLLAIADSDSRTRGLAIGKAAAQAMLALRQNDGSTNAAAWPAGKQPGEYRPTPPDFTPALGSLWGNVRPFVLKTSDQFRPAPPPAAGSERARADLEEVRRLGGLHSTERTHEQSEIACFWYEMSTRGWNRIAREVASIRRLDTWEQARLFALVNMAMADGYIAGFEAKYHYNYWRPATLVRESGEPEWLAYLRNPPVPDYPSTHSVLGAAAAVVIARSVGTDLVCFSLTSGDPYPNITRRFWSLSQAARENGASRVLCGVHFSSAVEAGYAQGEAIGTWAYENALTPVSSESIAIASLQ